MIVLMTHNPTVIKYHVSITCIARYSNSNNSNEFDIKSGRGYLRCTKLWSCKHIKERVGLLKNKSKRKEFEFAGKEKCNGDKTGKCVLTFGRVYRKCLNSFSNTSK